MLAYGYYPPLSDLAKIAQLFHDGGKHDGEQILHPAKIEELIYGTQERGLPTGERNRYGEGRYHMAFWHDRYDSADGCQLYLPMMRGWGGNIVLLMPAGPTRIRLAKTCGGGAAVHGITGIASSTEKRRQGKRS